MRDDLAVARMRDLVDSVSAPAGLRARVEADRSRRRRARALGGGVAAGIAVLAVGLVILLLPTQGPPTVLDAAALAARGPVAAAPSADPADPDVLTRRVEGVAFPSWGDAGSSRAFAARSDRLAGRDAATVYYAGARDARVAYTIVGGSPLAWPEGARRVVRRGVEVHLLRLPGTVVATWRRGGHQCVISAPASVSDTTMVALASGAGEEPAPPGYAGLGAHDG